MEIINIAMFRGLDPLVFCGICGVVSAGAGYALGTQIFKTLWKVLNKNQANILLEVRKRNNAIIKLYVFILYWYPWYRYVLCTKP